MNQRPKIAIIGRGISGLSLAYRLIKRGCEPYIFGHVGSSLRASEAAQGVICNKGLLWPRQALFQAKIRSLAWVKSWLSDIEAKTDCQVNKSFTGVFEPYRDPQDFHRIVQRVYKNQFTGCFRSENLARDALPEDMFAAASFAGTLFYPGDGWFDPQQLMRILEEYCLHNGAKIVVDDVLTIQPAKPQSELVLTSGKTMQFDKIVIAAGQGSEKLLQSMQLGEISFFYHPGQVLKIKNSGFKRQWAMVRKTHSLVSRDALYLGSTTDKLKTADQSWQPRERMHLWQILQEEFAWPGNQIEDYDLEDLWGVRVRISDRQPVIGSLAALRPGQAEWQQIYLMTGFYKNGLQLADMASSWIEQEMFSESIDPQAQAFHVKRFQKA
ncbi:MAG: NAD(P)/FAD-dependent oxidoreductase [Oligoflexus sp.]